MYINPNFNFPQQNYYRTNQYPRSIIYPRFNTPIKTKPIINLSKILDTTQRGINTINQIVPLYKQVTPIIKQVSTFTKSIGNMFFLRNQNNNNVERQYEDNNSSNNAQDYRKNENNSNPFFK